MFGHGISATSSGHYRRYFEEHGFVITTLAVRPIPIYVQGLPKMFSKTTKEDYWQKEYEHVGQAAVYNREIYLPHTTPDGVFGYSDRYYEYRRMQSMVTGAFADSTLDVWHMGRKFTSDPALNATFVNCSPTKRINQDTSSDNLYVMAYHDVRARRLVSKNSNSFTR